MVQAEVKLVKRLLEEGQNEAQVLLRQAREQAQSAIAAGHDAVKLQAQLRQKEARERLVCSYLTLAWSLIVDFLHMPFKTSPTQPLGRVVRNCVTL
jgi:hypothetical protein